MGGGTGRMPNQRERTDLVFEKGIHRFQIYKETV